MHASDWLYLIRQKRGGEKQILATPWKEFDGIHGEALCSLSATVSRSVEQLISLAAKPKDGLCAFSSRIEYHCQLPLFITPRQSHTNMRALQTALTHFHRTAGCLRSTEGYNFFFSLLAENNNKMQRTIITAFDSSDQGREVRSRVFEGYWVHTYSADTAVYGAITTSEYNYNSAIYLWGRLYAWWWWKVN